MSMRRPQQRLKRRSGRSEGARRALAITAVIGVLAAGVFAAREAIVELSKPVPLAAKPSDDEIYTGAILFVPDDGKTCRRFLFDNRTGRLSYNGLVDCESAYLQNRNPSPAQMSIARTQAISETFRHHGQ
jgi:hypothetical protein